MKTIEYNTTEVYEKLSHWWEAHDFPILSLNFLPKSCYIVSHKDVELYAAFLYKTDSGLAWLAFPVSNPEATKEQKTGGLEHLILDISTYAKDAGFEFIFTTSPLLVVQDALISNNFILGDEQVNHYIKKI